MKTCCVLKADVYGYGSLMHARADAPVRQALDDAVRRWARGAAVVETGGDSALVAHDDPVALAQAARHIIDDVYQTTGQPRLRVALHYGEVHVQAGVGDEPPMVVGGDAVLCATRVGAPCAAWTNLGDGRVPPATRAKAFALAHNRGDGAGRQ